MIRLSDLTNQYSNPTMKSLGAKPGQVIPNPYVRAFAPIEEAESDHEVSMAQNSLDTIIKNATELKQKIGSMEKNLPGWIQDHITNSENYIEQANSGYHELSEYIDDQGNERAAVGLPQTKEKEEVNEAKNIKVTFRSIAAKNKWMKNQKLKPTDKAVVSQEKSSLVLTPDMKDYVSKTNHKDLIYQVDMVNEAVKKGKKYGDWTVTQYEPVEYDDYGAPNGGRIKIVNQKTGNDLLIQNDLALRGSKWYISVNRKTIKDTNPEKVIQQAIKSSVNEVSDIKSGAVKMNSLVKDLEKELPKRISGNKKGILPPLGYGEPNYINFSEHIAMILKKNGISIEVDEFDKLVKTVFRNLKPKLTKTPNLIPSVGNTKLVHKKHKLDESVVNEDCGCSSKPINENVAKTILKQLGGNRFLAMTGARNMVSSGNSLSFKLPKAKGGINFVKITLTNQDLYDIDFGSIRGGKYSVKKSVDRVYWDELPYVFTQHTGLYTSL